MSRTFISPSAVGALALLVMSGGCASHGGQAAATHYWESADSMPQARYNRDNAVCRTEAGLPGPAEALQPEVPSFDAYAACMVARGYTLQAY